MSEEWLEYLKENNPELYAQAVASVEHSVRWRDRHIKGLESERDQLRAYVAELESENAKFKTFVTALKKLRRQRVEGPSFIPGVIGRSPLYMLFWSDIEPLIAKLERHPTDTNRVRVKEDV